MTESRNAAYWANAPREERPKSLEEFKEEVKAKIGIDFDSLPIGDPEDMMGAPLF